MMKVFPGSSFLQITQGVAKPPPAAGEQFGAALAETGRTSPPRAAAEPRQVTESPRPDRPRPDSPRGSVLDIRV